MGGRACEVGVVSGTAETHVDNDLQLSEVGVLCLNEFPHCLLLGQLLGCEQLRREGGIGGEQEGGREGGGGRWREVEGRREGGREGGGGRWREGVEGGVEGGREGRRHQVEGRMFIYTECCRDTPPCVLVESAAHPMNSAAGRWQSGVIRNRETGRQTGRR